MFEFFDYVIFLKKRRSPKPQTDPEPKEIIATTVKGFQPLTNVTKHKELHLRFGRVPGSASVKIFFWCLT